MIFNTLPIQAGGGLQKTLTLLDTISRDSKIKSQIVIVARKDSFIAKRSIDLGLNTSLSARGNLGRLMYELQLIKRFETKNICFTLSGPPMLFSNYKFNNIVECAYSNLLYPELDFWSEFSGHRRLKKNLIDLYRKKLLGKADHWIFQTEVLANRAINNFGFPENRVHYVQTAPNTNAKRDNISLDKVSIFNRLMPKGYRFLFLSGPNPNKQVHYFPLILKELKKFINQEPICITTMPNDHPYTSRVFKAFKDVGLEKNYKNLGTIKSDDVASCIEASNAMCTLSILESFTNNFVEAWQMQKPLICSNREWSSVGGDGVLRIDVMDYKSAAQKIAKLLFSEEEMNMLIKKGSAMLTNFSSPEDKLNEYIKVLNQAKELGKITKKEQRNIIW